MTSFDRIQDFQILNSLGNDQGYARKGNWKREKIWSTWKRKLVLHLDLFLQSQKDRKDDWLWLTMGSGIATEQQDVGWGTVEPNRKPFPLFYKDLQQLVSEQLKNNRIKTVEMQILFRLPLTLIPSNLYSIQQICLKSEPILRNGPF